jgi:hypothetical protein
MAIVMTGLLSVATTLNARSDPLGEFSDHTDIGAPKRAGTATYNAVSHQYIVTAGGANMFGAHDEFHFVWRKLRGDFILTAHIKFIGQGAEAHRKTGLIARSSLGDGASYVDGVIHGNGPTAMQLRRSDGANTEMLVNQPTVGVRMIGSATEDADFVQLERRGHTYIFSAARYGQPVTQRTVTELDLGDELYIGLFLCAHSPDATEQVVYRDVRIIRPAKTGR